MGDGEMMGDDDGDVLFLDGGGVEDWGWDCGGRDGEMMGR